MAATDSYRSHPAGGPSWRPPSHQRPLRLVSAPAKPAVEGPLSFRGSAQRIWVLTDDNSGVAKAATATLALVLTVFWWVGLAAWYAVFFVAFGIVTIPMRILRNRRQAAR